MTSPALPSFYILGAAKCGTTSLHDWLDQHPDVAMSFPKEPVFYESLYEKGQDFYRQKYFAHWDGQAMTGESRHRNLYLPYVPDRIKASTPDAKFIIILREPVERAHSHWWHFHRTYSDPLNFDTALADDLERIERGEFIETPEQIAKYSRVQLEFKRGPHRTYIDSGYYAQQIHRYFDRFDQSQFKILIFERVIKQPEETVRELCEFLGLDPGPAADFDYKASNRAKPIPLRRRLRWSTINILQQLNPLPGKRPPVVIPIRRPDMKPETARWLAEHYQPHNDQLRSLLNDPIEEWPNA